jgi:hypothetical protein
MTTETRGNPIFVLANQIQKKYRKREKLEKRDREKEKREK